MPNHNQVEIKRRNYNRLVAKESLEDYALRYTPSSFRNWSEFVVANTAIGSISFLALEAIGASIAINYGYENAFWGILAASIIIFLLGFPVCYYAAKHNIDIDLLTRAAGFGYLGSTITSLIYASFCFIFFALEAAIMAQALFLYLEIPLYIGYAICSIVIIPIVFYGMTAINRLQLYTQPIWLILMISPFIAVFIKEPNFIDAAFNLVGEKSSSAEFSWHYFGFSLGISLSLIAQIGEQVDYLRFMPDKTKDNAFKWWTGVILAGPGWAILGFLKQMGGVFLAALVLMGGASVLYAKEPIHMYHGAYEYIFAEPYIALAVSFLFVIISQIKINVTNAYAGSLAWSNFFSRMTHSHPGRVVWLIFNISIALLLMEMGVFDILENILGLYSNIAIAWISAIVADLVINKPLGLSPPIIEFKRAHLFNINPVGVFSTLIASILAVVSFSGLFGAQLQAFSSLVALVSAFICVPLIAWLTQGKYYIAREADFATEKKESASKHICGVCGMGYTSRDMASCSMYQVPICSLCCSLEARCHDSCKKNQPEFSLNEKVSHLIWPFFKNYLSYESLKRFVAVSLVFISIITTIGFIIWTSFMVNSIGFSSSEIKLAHSLYMNVFYILLLFSMVAAWLIVLMHENRQFVEAELTDKNKALDISEERFDLAMSVANDGIWDWNISTNEVLFDKRYYTMAGYQPYEFEQNLEQWEKRVHKEDLQQVLLSVKNLLARKKDKYDVEFRFRRKDGSYMWLRARGAVVGYDEQGKPLRCLGTHTDISDRKKAEEKIYHQANYDNLTQLPNRFLTLDRLTQLIYDAERNEQKVAILFLDLDDFKKINDSLGHETGDKVLIEAAHRLQQVIRKDDTVGRLGGDEFILIISHLIHMADAELVAKNIVNNFRVPFHIDDRDLILTASMGIAIYPDDGKSASELLANADIAMYNTKAQGRNNYSYFTENMNQKVLRRINLEEQLHGALERGELTVFYQPKVAISSGKLIGAEALLRWFNPSLGNVTPDEFIPIAEQTGLIVAIGEFVLQQSLMQTKQWQTSYPEYKDNFCIAINLSPRQFRDLNLVSSIEGIIKQSEINTAMIELEITEGVLMSGHQYIDKALIDLSELGLSIAMDDFGTGYSSLSYLRKYPFNIIKIDRSFINDISVDAADQELINATIAMAHGLNLKVVAEGVETQEQLDYLKQLGCDYAQGYLFSKPLPAKEMEIIFKSGFNSV